MSFAPCTFWATDPAVWQKPCAFSRKIMRWQLLDASKILFPFYLLQVAPRFRKNRTSNWFCNFSRIK